MGKMVKAARKILAGVIGFPLLLLGIILIPLPGPGVLLCFLALLILSLEFDWANRYYEKAKGIIRKIIDEAKAKQKDINDKYK